MLDTDAIVGLASAVLALLGALASGLLALRANRQAHELERQRRLDAQIETAEHVLRQYRDPLLDAAQTLQSRIYNIVGQAYLTRYLDCGDPEEERYARDYTVYALAEYLCWAEIVRRELRFLDVGDVERNRKLLAHLTQIQATLASDSLDKPFEVFRGRQRAIAELMMVPTNASEGPRNECMGYATFCHRLDSDPEFAAWFNRLRYQDIDAVADSRPEELRRLRQVQWDLIDLIDFLDEKAVRIPPMFRARLPVPAPAATASATAASE